MYEHSGLSTVMVESPLSVTSAEMLTMWCAISGNGYWTSVLTTVGCNSPFEMAITINKQKRRVWKQWRKKKKIGPMASSSAKPEVQLQNKEERTGWNKALYIWF